LTIINPDNGAGHPAIHYSRPVTEHSENQLQSALQSQQKLRAPAKCGLAESLPRNIADKQLNHAHARSISER
jgi:hypothetical protein